VKEGIEKEYEEASMEIEDEPTQCESETMEKEG